MSQLLIGVLAALIPSAVVGILTAFVTVRLAEKRFRSEKWWEKRQAAYAEITESLTTLLYCLGEWESEQLDLEKFTEEQKKQTNADYARAKEILKRAGARGAIYVSDKAAEAVRVLLRDLGNPPKGTPLNDWFAILQADYDRVSGCLLKVNELFKKHLRVE